MQRELLFGANVHPGVEAFDQAVAISRLADAHGLHMVTCQDHPYNPDFLDTWTLLSVLASKTKRVHIGTNVANLPLRPPAMLAKAAASMDRLSGGRVELGIGAGASPAGVRSLGGPGRSGAEALQAFEEGLHVIRKFWEADSRVSYRGDYYQLYQADTGPAPAHPIRIWVGGYGERMTRLVGQSADGWLVSSSYLPPEAALEKQAAVDEGAEQAGRQPTSVRRGYNLMGVIQTGDNDFSAKAKKPGILIGTPEDWREWILEFHHKLRFDTFICWPIGGDEVRQIEIFAREIAPGVREEIGRGGREVSA
jgi:alkanesulfonate monooxygenase SsuD/methylene tetrahydromethanopterin reductase-like flavin-dependent oxidoreductase (luciferase family)